MVNENNRNKDVNYVLIDSPVTPYSSIEDIKAWIEELRKLPDTREVKEEVLRMDDILKNIMKLSDDR